MIQLVLHYPGYHGSQLSKCHFNIKNQNGIPSIRDSKVEISSTKELMMFIFEAI